MRYIIAAFKSQNEAMAAFELLTNNKITARLTNTPQGAHLGCGISVKIDDNSYEKANALLSGRYSTFAGFFSVVRTNGHTIVTKM